MAWIRVSTLLDAVPDAVWGDLEDLESHPEWMADAVGIRFLGDQRSGVGTRFECDTKVGPLRLNDVMEITEWVPGRAMGVTHTGLVTGRGRFTLEPAGPAGTRFEWREQLVFPWWMAGPLGAFLAKPVLTWVWRRSLRNLQRRF